MAKKKAIETVIDMSGTRRQIPAGADIATEDYLRQGYRPPAIETSSGKPIGGASQLPPPRKPQSTGLIRRTLGRTALGAIAYPVAEELISAAVPAIDSGAGYGDLPEAMTFGTLPSDRPMRAPAAAIPDNVLERPAAQPAARQEAQAAPQQAAVQAAASTPQGALPPGFVTEMRGLQTSYYNPETQVRAATPQAAEIFSRPAPTNMEEYLQRAAAVSSDPRQYVAALGQLRQREAAAELRRAEINRRIISDELKRIDESLSPDISKGQRAPTAKEREELMRKRNELMGFQSLLLGPQAAGYAEGGEVENDDYEEMEIEEEEGMDVPMAIDPTMAGKAAGMESGDYVFPVEAVQFYGLKMLKDMVKKAMTAD